MKDANREEKFMKQKEEKEETKGVQKNSIKEEI